ncbi:hypothetical protein EEL32_03620 [Brevibacillus laterosporus]|uniref:Uncharacterized protein n=1 Tax=Brevibacillus laterosporus TaxID=1465 RepID=A0A502IY13_BRELA|nr:hypothetical protein [Brevibacillus laterosporus]QDX95443.1 hypothetical protein EEL30_26130 [Brevibacillus laterosporus]TPG69358.1 hypothetical protein EEL31_13090 [Brevibacillus laterosporus]TPG90578.1 hypothetical protein EEL32_03620 [Brevibacillus laterosporus]
MNKLLNQEVEKLLEFKINVYYAALERERKATQKQYKQERTIRELERQLKEAEKRDYPRDQDTHLGERKML